MSWFIRAMVSPAGRALRVVAGVVLIGWGLLGSAGVAGIVVAIVGLVPLVAGAVDGCVFAPLFGYQLSGPRTRALLAAGGPTGRRAGH
jgi:hypothetical protein